MPTPSRRPRLRSAANPPIAIAFVILAMLLAACTSAAPSSPPPSGAPSPGIPSPTAPSPSPAPSDPLVTPAPATPVPTAAPTPVQMTDEELALVHSLRVNAQVRCEPRRTGLPEGATVGVECRVNSGPIGRVGAYLFADPDVELAHYLARLEQYGVEPNTGACWDGTPGDSAWVPGDYEWPEYELMNERSGCFLDENGIANARVLCGGMYIGVLGTNGDLQSLFRWTAEYDDNYQGDVPAPPGICYGPNTPT